MDGTGDESLSLIRHPPLIKNSLLGMRRACNTVTTYERIFLGIITVNLTFLLGVVLFRIFDLPTSSSEFPLAILRCINIIFSFFYAFHGVLYEQPYEILVLVMSTAIIVVYSTISYIPGDISDDNFIKVANVFYTDFMGSVVIVIGLHIGYNYSVSRNLVFRTVGGDPFMQSICGKVQIQCVLLLFDLQAMLSCLILINDAVDITLLEELIFIIIGIIFILGWTILGYLTVRFESSVCVAIFLVLSCLHPSFIVWRIINNGLYQSDDLKRLVCYTSGVTFLLVHIYLIMNTFQVYKNFGKGLKEKIYGQRGDNPQYGTFHAVDA